MHTASVWGNPRFDRPTVPTYSCEAMIGHLLSRGGGVKRAIKEVTCLPPVCLPMHPVTFKLIDKVKKLKKFNKVNPVWKLEI